MVAVESKGTYGVQYGGRFPVDHSAHCEEAGAVKKWQWFRILAADIAGIYIVLRWNHLGNMP